MLRVRLVRMLLLAAMVAAAVIWVLPVLLMLVGKILDQVVILLRVLLLMWVPWHSRGRRRRPQKIDGDFSLHRKAVVLFPSDAAAGTTAAMGTDNRLVSQTTHIVVSRRFLLTVSGDFSEKSKKKYLESLLLQRREKAANNLLSSKAGCTAS